MEGTGLYPSPLPAEDPPMATALSTTTSRKLTTYYRKQCTLFDVGKKTVPKEMSSRVDHSIMQTDPAVVQQREHRRQAHQDREQRAREPANTPDMVGQNRLVMRLQRRVLACRDDTPNGAS